MPIVAGGPTDQAFELLQKRRWDAVALANAPPAWLPGPPSFLPGPLPTRLRPGDFTTAPIEEVGITARRASHLLQTLGLDRSRLGDAAWASMASARRLAHEDLLRLVWHVECGQQTSADKAWELVESTVAVAPVVYGLAAPFASRSRRHTVCPQSIIQGFVG